MRFAKPILAVLFAALAGLPAAAQDKRSQDLATLKTLLLQLKVNPYPPPRERSAQLLVALIRRMDVSAIDQATIDEIAGYLDDNSDAVRGRMAIALGNIGVSAKHTVPALEKAFVRAKDYIATAQNNLPSISRLSTSADGICFALWKLEAATLPEGCYEARYTPPAPADATATPAN